MNTDPWTICQWCFREIQESEIPGWHEECVMKMAEFAELVQLGQEIAND